MLKRRSAEARFVYRIVYVRSFNDLGRGYGGLPALAFKADLKLHVPQNAVDAGVCVTRLAVDRGLRVIRGLRALAPRTMYFDNSLVALNASPDAVLAEVDETLAPMPAELVETYKQELGGAVE